MTSPMLTPEALEAAMVVAYERFPQSGKSYEECYGVEPLANTDDVEEGTVFLRAFLAAQDREALTNVALMAWTQGRGAPRDQARAVIDALLDGPDD